MKISINRQYFIEQLNHCLKAISPRTTLPILSGIKIDVSDDQMVLTGSDSEISIEITIPTEIDNEEILEIESPGSVVLTGRFFVDIIKKLSGDFVELETNEQFSTKITAGKSEFNLSGQDANQYPLLPEVNEADSLVMSSTVLKTIINQTNFAVSLSETRPVLTGVNWLFKDDHISFTATDSHRLALRKLLDKTFNTDASNAIIPGKSLSELSKILSDSDEDVEINLSQNQVLFTYGNMRFISRLLEGNYPDTTRLFPENYETKVNVNNAEFYHAIDRVSLLAREGGNNVIRMSVENGNVELTSNSPEVGTVNEEVTASSIEGEDIKISFNSKYMMDALRAIQSEEVTVEFFGTMRPFTITPSDSTEVVQLILPIRTY
ncbi:DNA polymerase III subunit beta [Jeotgalicoccus huakuii]|uniref:DNA polymerase III subunit beta n=1 Tax=Jeotgalicoccus TaxID=227979 RepID=UPI00040716CD|nr:MULTISPECIES: DNA polymerase III subunit beta [Jeotgalicoccus]MCK1977538.1 DNA polymerase III subunit beta [Jeotgalicoccus huakuii]QQD84496.1 DNA polymerase III subunit beta [Jeotgalicoccus sp. ATCC 8456]